MAHLKVLKTKNIADNLTKLGYNSFIITKRIIKVLLVLKTSIAFITFFYINIIFASNFSSKAEYATVIDLDTEAVLYSKNANSKVYPASMSKLMTLYILFEEIQNGLLLESKLNVSKKAGVRWL